MKKLLCVLGVAGIVFAESALNWSTLEVRVTVPNQPLEAEPGKEVVAASILDALKPACFDAEMTVEEFWARNPMAEAKIGKFTVFPKKVQTRFLSDGSAELEYEIPLTGPILDGLMPETGGGKPLTPMCCPVCKRTWPEGEPVPPGVSLVPKEEEHPIPYTGVLVDARGLGLNPAFFPKISNEDGMETYGLDFVLRPYAVERGLVSYVYSTQEAYQSERLGMNPLRITALRSKGRNRTDLVIANPDAQKLHSSQWSLRLLERCQVVVLIDR
jgi:hypothetical protein